MFPSVRSEQTNHVVLEFKPYKELWQNLHIIQMKQWKFSPHHEYKKTESELWDCSKNVLQCTILYIYTREEFPTTKNHVMEMRVSHCNGHYPHPHKSARWNFGHKHKKGDIMTLLMNRDIPHSASRTGTKYL